MTGPTNGVVEEGKLVRVAAITTDDVQVRNVEFFVDGVETANDASFPFEYRFVTPTLTSTRTNFTLQAKATDTGGNATFTPVITVRLVPDATPPRVTRVFPAPQAIVGSINFLAAFFSEPVHTGSVNTATFQLKSAGTDGILGNADDRAVTNGIVSYRTNLNEAVLSFPTNLPPGDYEATVNPPIADLAGNLMVCFSIRGDFLCPRRPRHRPGRFAGCCGNRARPDPNKPSRI